MSSPGVPPLELESLVVRIIGDATSLIATVPIVQQAVTDINLALTALQGGASATQTVVAATATTVSNMTRAMTVSSRSIGRLGTVLQGLGTQLQNLSALNFANMAPLSQLMTNLSLTPRIGAHIASFGRGINSLISSMSGFTALNMTQAVAQGQKFINWINMWAGINPAAVANMSRVGLAMSRITAYFNQPSGFRPPPPIINNTNMLGAAAATGAYGRAANGAARSTQTLTGRLRDLFYASGAASGALSMLRLTAAGLAGFGLFAFAKTDDALTRTLVHMQEFNNLAENRAAFKEAISDQATKSATSTTDLAKGLDVLASAGLSAGMAVKALGTAETFAVASGMEMADATRRLVDIQRTLGKEGKTPEEYYANMARISDLFVGISRTVGSTEQQMTDAFSGHFLVALQNANMSMEQGLALLGAYSLRSKDFRGREGGDTAARAIMELSKHSATEFNQWERMGFAIKKTKDGAIDMADVADQLTAKFGHLEPTQRAAAMSLLGFENRAIFALSPLIGMGDAMRQLQERMQGLNGISEESANVLRNSFSFQMRIMWNTVNITAQAVGERLVPAVRMLTSAFGSLLAMFNKLNPAYQNLIVLSLALVLLARPLTYAFMTLFSIITGPFVLAFQTVYGIMAGMVSFAGLIGRTFLHLALNLTTMIGSMMMSLWTTMFAIITGFVPILINLTIMAALLPVVAGVAVTLIIGAAQLFRSIVAGAAAFWTSIRDEIPNFFRRTGENLAEMGSAGVQMWKRIQENSKAWFDSLRLYLQMAAGFFWNFGENVQRIFKWMEQNWETITQDMGKMFVVFIENAAKNIGVLGGILGDVLGTTWNFIWDSAYRYWKAGFGWIKAHWADLASDMETIFVTMLTNIVKNIVTIISSLAGLVSAVMANEAAKANIQGLYNVKIVDVNKQWYLSGGKRQMMRNEVEDWREAELKKLEDPFKTAMQNMVKNFVGPLAGLDVSKLKMAEQGFGGIATNFTLATRDIIDDMKKQYGGLFDRSNAARNDLIPLLEGFEAITKPLVLELGLPANAPQELLEKMKRMAAPQLGGPEEEMGRAGAKQGPGFQFRQISLERFMIGGEAAEKLDYEQLVTLKIIADRLTTLVAIQRGQANKNQGFDPFDFLFVGP